MSTNVTIRKNRVRFDGVNFYRSGAASATLGSYGEKKTGATNQIVVAGRLSKDAMASIEVDRNGPYSVNWSKENSADLNLGGPLKFLSAAGGTAAITRDTAHSARLELLQFSCVWRELKAALNGIDHDARNFLFTHRKKNIRIVSSVLVAVSGELASTIKGGAAISFRWTGAQLKLTVAGTEVTDVTLPSGATFAYLLHRVTKWSPQNTVQFMKQDAAGLG